jgi:transposase
LSEFERGQSVGEPLVGASVTKTATLSGVSTATVSKVMSTYANHGKTSAGMNNGRKSTLIERVRRTLRRIISRNQRTAAVWVTAELNIHLEEVVSTKAVRRKSFTNPTSMIGLQLLNL